MTGDTTLANKLHPNLSLTGSWRGERLWIQKEAKNRRRKWKKFIERVRQGRLHDSFLLSKRPTLSQHSLCARCPYAGTSDPGTIKGLRASQAHLLFPALRKRRVLCLGLSSSHLVWLGRASETSCPDLLHKQRESCTLPSRVTEVPEMHTLNSVNNMPPNSHSLRLVSIRSCAACQQLGAACTL